MSRVFRAKKNEIVEGEIMGIYDDFGSESEDEHE